MDSSSARLSIPKGQMRADFLAQEDQEQREPNSTSCKGMRVPLIEPSLPDSTIILEKWKLDSGISYIFGSGWQTVAKKNWLKADDIIQPWSFESTKDPAWPLLSFRFLSYNFFSSHFSTYHVLDLIQFFFWVFCLQTFCLNMAF